MNPGMRPPATAAETSTTRSSKPLTIGMAAHCCTPAEVIASRLQSALGLELAALGEEALQLGADRQSEHLRAVPAEPDSDGGVQARSEAGPRAGVELGKQIVPSCRRPEKTDERIGAAGEGRERLAIVRCRMRHHTAGVEPLIADRPQRLGRPGADGTPGGRAACREQSLAMVRGDGAPAE